MSRKITLTGKGGVTIEAADGLVFYALRDGVGRELARGIVEEFPDRPSYRLGKWKIEFEVIA